MGLECCSIFFYNAHGYNVHKNNSCALMRTLTMQAIELFFSFGIPCSAAKYKRMREKGEEWWFWQG